MSSELYKAAYETRLGNLTAKSVLVKICDHSNPQGFGYPSIETIAYGAEISERTVLRVVQVFCAIGLAERKKAWVEDRHGRREVMAIFLNVEMLGSDLAERFAVAFAKAQGKGGRCLRDSKASVSETDSGVSETLFDVSETLPPHPLLGGTTTEPSLNHQQAARDEDAANLTREQQQHLDRLAAEGGETGNWRAHYLAENREKARAAAAKADAAAAEAKREAELKAMYPDRARAIAMLRKQCGFAWTEGDLLGPMFEAVFRDQEELGRTVWAIASQMREMWELQRKQGRRLRARYGPMNFFKDGHWLSSDGWHWNVDERG